jgi:hypothetical protein
VKGVTIALALLPAVGGCDRQAPGIDGRIETIPQRMKRQAAEFEATPDIKGAELTARLSKLGIEDTWITPAIEENGIEVLMLRVPADSFAKLDHRAFAKLRLDSRYRFDFSEPEQARTAAFHHGAELHVRDRAKALQQLKERGQLGSYPRYRNGMALNAFAPQLEVWCGYERGQAFRVIEGNWVDYAHPMVDLAVVDSDGRASASFDCVKRVVDATPELRRRFIGNRGREGAIDY